MGNKEIKNFTGTIKDYESKNENEFMKKFGHIDFFINEILTAFSISDSLAKNKDMSKFKVNTFTNMILSSSIINFYAAYNLIKCGYVSQSNSCVRNIIEGIYTIEYINKNIAIIDDKFYTDWEENNWTLFSTIKKISKSTNELKELEKNRKEILNNFSHNSSWQLKATSNLEENFKAYIFNGYLQNPFFYVTLLYLISIVIILLKSYYGYLENHFLLDENHILNLKKIINTFNEKIKPEIMNWKKNN